MPSFENLPFPFTSVILTGGSSGIGKSLIEHIERLNPGVPICNLSRRCAEGFSAELKRRQVMVDLSDSASRVGAISEVLAFLEEGPAVGPILLINNAGFGNYGEFHLSNAATQREIIEVNLNAIIDLTSGLMPILLQRGGTVMNVASVTAFQPTPYIATYGATKAFLLQWGYALRHELRETSSRDDGLSRLDGHAVSRSGGHAGERADLEARADSGSSSQGGPRGAGPGQGSRGHGMEQQVHDQASHYSSVGAGHANERASAFPSSPPMSGPQNGR